MVVTEAWTLDVSVAIKWYLRDEELLEQADAVFSAFVDGSLGIATPDYFFDEASNILRTAVIRGRLTADQARDDHSLLLNLGTVTVEPTAARRSAALDIALTHNIAYYDALYLQVSDEIGIPLLTADRPFFERIVGAFPTTRFLGEL
ncbi:MAG: type II toxin-antitoxin system VapC family toxin [Dehalococcoidia bacterium]